MGELRHYALIGATPRTPSLFFEAQVDIQDSRSGYRDSRHSFFQAEWLEDPDFKWTRDMVREISPDWLEEIVPPSPLQWPFFGDQKIVEYLGEHFRPRIWKNYSLEMYSTARENREELIARCREALLPERNLELRKLREIFMRRFMEMEHRLVGALEQGPWDQDVKTRYLFSLRNTFSNIREDLRCWSLREDHRPAEDFSWTLDVYPEFQEKVNDLRAELIEQYDQINAQYEQRAGQVESYEVPLSYPRIEVLARGIVWK